MRPLFLAIAYFATGWLGLKLPYIGSHITLVWLPTGIAVAALFRWGFSVWPGIYLAAFLVNLSIGSTWPLAASIAVGNTLGPLLTVFWLKRAEFRQGFDRQRDVGFFVAAAGGGMAISAVGGVVSLYLGGVMPLKAVVGALLSWWMGDTVGVLLAAPLLLTLTLKSLRQLVLSLKELLLWVLVAGSVAWLAFLHDYAEVGSLPLAYLTLPLFAWAAMRFGNTGAALAGITFSLVAAWSTSQGRGTFVIADTHISLFLLWGYMATTVLTGLLITAMQAERRQVESALRESETKLRGLYELSPLGIALTDMDGRYLEFNEAFREICGYPADELKALDYWTLTPKKYAADEARQIEAMERTGRYGPYEKEYMRKNGSLVALRLNGLLMKKQDGQKYIWSIVEDISDQRRIESDLRIAATAFESQVATIVADANRVILRVNQAFTEDTGYTAEEVVGKTPGMFKSGRHNAAFYAEMWRTIRCTGAWQGEVWDRRKNGEIYPTWMSITAVPGADGTASHYVSTQVNIAARKAAEDAIQHLAFYDPLTDLPNRRLLFDRLHQALATSARNHSHGALLFIDLDNFKILNDTLGHAKGDLLLQQVAQRLSGSVREGDTVARLGGDEFVVMLENLSPHIGEAATQAKLVGEKIFAAIKQPYLLKDRDYCGTPSIGVTLFSDHNASIDELLQQADLAMYQAKAAGRNAVRFFDPAMQEAVTDRALLESDLRSAVQQEQITPYFQAQVDGTGAVTGAEVLVRWLHPQRGMVMPNDFIPLAEETGLILPLGHWVLERACTQLAEWSANPVTAQLTLAVNISVKQLHQADFVEQVLGALQRSGADPRKLRLEITESLLLSEVEDIIAKMTALKASGVGFALDDFGTGYSSLSYLKRLPLDTLKIDRSFVMDVLADPNAAAIAQTIVALAQSLGLPVIAEGVETAKQRDFLAANGCFAYQGYLFSRPVPLHEFEQFLHRERLQTAVM